MDPLVPFQHLTRLKHPSVKFSANTMARLTNITHVVMSSGLLLLVLLAASPARAQTPEQPAQRAYTRSFVKPAPEGEGTDSGPGGFSAAAGVQVQAGADVASDTVGIQNLGGSNFWMQWSAATPTTFPAKGTASSTVNCPAGKCG
jgi:hypothetical protein